VTVNAAARRRIDDGRRPELLHVPLEQTREKSLRARFIAATDFEMDDWTAHASSFANPQNSTADSCLQFQVSGFKLKIHESSAVARANPFD
jgi:hypothetical protein